MSESEGENALTTDQEDLNPFHIARQQFDRATPHLPKLKRGLIEFLKSPARTITVCFPIELDDGSVRNFTPTRRSLSGETKRVRLS